MFGSAIFTMFLFKCNLFNILCLLLYFDFVYVYLFTVIRFNLSRSSIFSLPLFQILGQFAFIHLAFLAPMNVIRQSYYNTSR